MIQNVALSLSIFLTSTSAVVSLSNRFVPFICDHTQRAALHCTDPSGKGSLEPTSPRSVEACLRLGVEPSELHFMPLDIFLARFRERDLADIAYNHHETVRQVWHTIGAP